MHRHLRCLKIALGLAVAAAAPPETLDALFAPITDRDLRESRELLPPPELTLPTAPMVLDLRDDPEKGVILSGVTEFTVQDPKEVINLLNTGNKRRTTEATMANSESSRSHAIC